MADLAFGRFELRVGRSRTGRGLFACEEIPKGARIIEYVGKVVDPDTIRYDRGKYLFATSKTKTIDGNIRRNRARFINHSCAPNCDAEGPNGRIFIVSRRRIKPGEELTYNYGKEYFDQHIKPKGCLCTKCAAAGTKGRRTAEARARGKATTKRKAATKPRSKAGTKARSKSTTNNSTKRKAAKRSRGR